MLAGPAASGKSTWAQQRFAATEVVSSDALRGVLGDDEARQDINDRVFPLLHDIVQHRLDLGRLTVVDATNLERKAREPLRLLAKKSGIPAVLLVITADLEGSEARAAGRARRVSRDVLIDHVSRVAGVLMASSDEGWSAVHAVAAEDLPSLCVERTPLAPDHRERTGPFDVVGDVHGCLDELDELLDKLGYDDGRHPEGRTLVFVGDLVDRGPDSVGVLRRVLPLIDDGRALLVPGNHEAKFVRWLEHGDSLRVSGGLATTVAEWNALPRSEQSALREQLLTVLDRCPDHLVLDGGALVVAHAGLQERWHGRVGNKARALCLYGLTTGRVVDGLPERLDWAVQYRGAAAVIHGHVPRREADWRNNVLDIDLGCVFGGHLAAARWPERDVVVVPARKVWWPRKTPPGSTEAA